MANKVEQIIGDPRMENMVMNYLMSKGIEFCQSITDEDIDSLEGNGLMTAEFMQDMVRKAREIAQTCEWIDIITFIRLYMWCTPSVKKLEIYRDDYSEGTFLEILQQLDLGNDQVGDRFEVFTVIDWDTIEEA